jgi:hypothetical protein
LKYCPIGLTGSSNCSSYSCSIVQKKKIYRKYQTLGCDS